MLIAQITDSHVVEEGTKAIAGRVDTNAYLERAVAFVNALDPAPDLVLHTGDVINDERAAQYDAAVARLGKLSAPLYAIPGNHDDREAMRVSLGGLGAVPSVEETLCYTVEDFAVRLICLDTQEPGKPHGVLDDARTRWLAERLAEQSDRPTIIAMHHPPFLTGIAHMDAIRCFEVDGLAQLLTRHRNVQRILCGHLHRHISTTWQGVTAMTVPATAHQVALDLGEEPSPAAFTLEPPTVALHRWSETAGLVSHVVAIGDYAPQPYHLPAS